jgi:hypothetical protein
MHHRSTRHNLVSIAFAGVLAASAAAGDLYVAGDQGLIWHLDTASGVLDNPIAGGGPVQGMALQGRDVLAATSDGRIFRVDLETGVTKDGFLTQGSPLSLTRWGNTLYLTTDLGDMQWLDAETGSIIDTYYTNDPLQATVLFGNTIFTGSWSTFVYTAPIGELDFQFFTACGGSVNSMTTDGTDLIIGAREGTVYFYDAQTGGYKATYAVASDCVGISFIEGRVFIAGSDGKVHRMDPSNGSIDRVYDTGLDITAMVAAEPCAADFDGDGTISTLDFLAFLNAWVAQDSTADTDGNGVINTQDVLVFLNAFTAGCVQ